jgi:hypothetical protein
VELMKSSLSILSDNEYVELMYFSEDILVVIRPNKKICVLTVTCPKNLGSVGRHNLFYFFFLLSAKPEIVVPGS